jgi:leader peptidase (prepilin peptidase)/N-methyltransferase
MSWGIVLPLVTAPIVGSFLGVIIDRLPAGESIVRGRSHCPHCRTTLTPRDLIPFLSWIASRGACRHCGASLGLFYPAVEGASLLVALSIVATVPRTDVAVIAFSLVLGWTLLALAWIDARHLLLPDALTLPLLAMGFIATEVIAPDDLIPRAIGALCGYLALTVVAMTYRRLRGRSGLGAGDAKLMAVAGAWLGWQALPTVLLVASVVTLLVYLGGMLTRGPSRGTWSDKVPFGPGLAAAIWLVWLLGPIEFPIG